MSDENFLKILKSALSGEQIAFNRSLSADEWKHIFMLAENHRVLPMILDSIHASFNFDITELKDIRNRSKLLITQQVIQTQNFLDLYKKLSVNGFNPIVVKGIVCRSLYPKPDFRLSADEDILVPDTQFELYENTLKSLGFVATNINEPNRYETSFVGCDGLHIELHKSLFTKESEYFKKWNRIFDGAVDRATYVDLENIRIKTLSPSDHILYLILHALKHFLHSGFGIRQICDIIMFANSYYENIDWYYIYSQCEQVHALKFAAAIFAIGDKYLGLDKIKGKFPEQWKSISTDELPLLCDVLSAGVYGSTSLGRRHSSSITLKAAQGQKESIIKKIFPPADSLGKQYRYVQKHPILLPVAWISRLLKYSKEVNVKSNNTPAISIQIGKERIELLKKYEIISYHLNF